MLNSCGGDGSETSPIDVKKFNSNFDEKLKNWMPPVELVEGESIADLIPSTENLSTTDGIIDCSYEARNITQYVSELPAWINSFSSLQPGLLIGSRDLKENIISVIPTGSRNVPLFISTGIPAPSILVESANSSSIKTAISELQRRVAESNVPIPATISLKTEIITSNSEFEDAYGLSAGIASSSGASLNFGESSSGSGNASQKYLVVKLVQPMYSISVSHDQYLVMSDFFGSITENLWDEYNSDRWMTPEYPPVFVSDVTYGRMIIFKIQVDKSSSNNEVKQSFGLDTGETSSGSANVSVGGNSAFANALAQSRVELLALGGSQEAAFEALRTGDFTSFFKIEDPRTAVPLNYIARHVTGNREVVAVRSTLSYTAADCLICSPALETEEISRSTGLYQTGTSKPSLFSGCRQTLQPKRFNWENCGTRQRFSYLINRFGKCSTAWTTNNPSNCSVDVTGEDSSGAGGGDCQVRCQLSIVAQQVKPNQPPLCQF